MKLYMKCICTNDFLTQFKKGVIYEYSRTKTFVNTNPNGNYLLNGSTVFTSSLFMKHFADIADVREDKINQILKNVHNLV